MKKRRNLLIMVACCLMMATTLGGCVSQEAYDRVTTERDNLQEEIREIDSQARQYFESIDGLSVFESGNEEHKSLFIVCYAELHSDDEKMSEISSAIEEKLREAKEEWWFDYEYIILDFWSDTLGRIVSMTIDADDLSKPMQLQKWYESEEDINENNMDNVEETDEAKDELENEIEEAPEEAEPEAREPIELSTGKYIVGEDIPSGKYDIIGVSRGNIHVCSKGKEYGDVVSEIIEEGEVVYANVRLEDGYTVELVLGGKVQLQPK